MADETSDMCSDEQLSISIRYCLSEPDENGELIRKVFLGFIHLENLTTVGVASKICDFLKNAGLNIDLIRGNILTKKNFSLDNEILRTIDQSHVSRRSGKETTIVII